MPEQSPAFSETIPPEGLPPEDETGRRRAEIAYLLPMLTFLAFTWAGSQWPSWYAASYVAKTLVVAVMLALFWKQYTRIRWDCAVIGIIVGALVVFQWVGMEKALEHVWPHYPRPSSGTPFNPLHAFSTPAAAACFIAVRWAGASLLVPVMEELFWRDGVWRFILSPDDFRQVPVGTWSWKAYLLVSVLFGLEHFIWITGIVTGLIYGALLVRTRSLGACILAHGVTNFLLGLYVLVTHDWAFW